MKNFFIVLAALLLLFACTPQNNNSGGQITPDELIVTGDALEIEDRSATLTGYANLPIEYGDAVVGVMCDKNQSFEEAQKIVATILDANNKFSVTAIGLSPATTYYFKSFVQNGMAVKYGAVKSFTTKEPTCPEGAVDLGIVIQGKKLYWGKTNISRNGLCANPQDYGDYYAWGEIEPKLTYESQNYKYGKNEYGPFSKYNSEDQKAVLDMEDDIAHVKLGGKWRMPTDEEWTALRDQCTWEWTSDYNRTGVAGCIVTSNVDGFKDKSIFLPATGFYDPRLALAGSHGYYWSSSLLASVQNQGCLILFSDQDTKRTSYFRCSGLSIRPVSE